MYYRQGRRCTENSLLLDVGGNVGWYSGFFVANGCRTITVEAQTFAYAMIMATMELNLKEPSQCAEVWNRAVTSGSQMVTMSGNTAWKGGNSIILDSELTLRDSELTLRTVDTVEVQGIALDVLLRTSGLVKGILRHFTRVSVPLIKIDIEGSEMHALEGISRLLHSEDYDCGAIFVELHSDDWFARSGFTKDRSLRVFQTFFSKGYCLREVRYSECCKGPYKNKLDWPCCLGASEQLWPNWSTWDDVPSDVLGKVILSSTQLSTMFPVRGDFFLSRELCHLPLHE